MSLSRIGLKLRSGLEFVRCFSWASRRAVVYSANGDPAQVLSVKRIPPLSDYVPPGHVGIRFLVSPINPADLNVIQGAVVIHSFGAVWMII